MKKKDKFYKNGLKGHIYFAIIVLCFGIIWSLIVGNFLKKKDNFMNNATKTMATIIEIKYESKIDDIKKTSYDSVGDEKIKYIKVEYNVAGVRYEGNLKEYDSNMRVGDKIQIFYDKDNPEDFIQNNSKTNSLLKIFGYAVCVLGSILLVSAIKKMITYKETLNGIEVEAEIIEVIKKQYMGIPAFKLKCLYKDADGVERIVYSKNFLEPYFEDELKKSNIKNVVVRYKRENPRRYIVLTEKIDKILSK